MSEHIETLHELREGYKAPENVNQVHRSRLSKIDRIALLITQNVGTMGFFFFLIAWVGLWVLWNVFGPADMRFDPFPAFVLLLFMSNILSLFLIPLVLVGQNIQSKHAELRSEYEYIINRKAEKEDEVILKRLERQEVTINKILEKLEQLEKKV